MHKRLALDLRSGIAYVEIGFKKPDPPPLALLPAPDPEPLPVQVTDPKPLVPAWPKGDKLAQNIYLRLFVFVGVNGYGACVSDIRQGLPYEYRNVSRWIIYTKLRVLVEQGFVRTTGKHSWTKYWPIVLGK